MKTTNYKINKQDEHRQGTLPATLNGTVSDVIDGFAFLDLQRQVTTEPEKLLLLAVLERAVLDIRDTRRKVRADRKDALEWVRSMDEHWPFAFAVICDVFNFDANHVRNILTRGKV